MSSMNQRIRQQFDDSRMFIDGAIDGAEKEDLELKGLLERNKDILNDLINDKIDKDTARKVFEEDKKRIETLDSSLESIRNLRQQSEKEKQYWDDFNNKYSNTF